MKASNLFFLLLTEASLVLHESLTASRDSGHAIILQLQVRIKMKLKQRKPTAFKGCKQLLDGSLPQQGACRVYLAENGGTLTFGLTSKITQVLSNKEIKS